MSGFTKAVAKELGSRNIRSNAIAPGFIITEMTGKLPEKLRNEWIKTIPLRRGGTPEDVANTTVFLASDLSSYVSGQVINVCGAMTTQKIIQLESSFFNKEKGSDKSNNNKK